MQTSFEICHANSSVCFRFQMFRKYRIEYNYGPLTYKVSPTYVPVEPLKFKLTPVNR